jgi:hypothetical protein
LNTEITPRALQYLFFNKIFACGGQFCLIVAIVYANTGRIFSLSAGQFGRGAFSSAIVLVVVMDAD